jgi:UDP-N-acetyl-D-galactosamine dehydrogenase
VHDPHGDAAEALHEYGVTLLPFAELQPAAAVVVAVAHHDYCTLAVEQFKKLMGENPVLIDVKSICDPVAVQGAGIRFWRL